LYSKLRDWVEIKLDEHLIMGNGNQFGRKTMLADIPVVIYKNTTNELLFFFMNATNIV